MNILAWFNPARWLMLAVAVAALTAGYFGWANHQQGIGRAEGRQEAKSEYDGKIKAQKNEATKLLAEETAKATAAGQALQDFKDQQEIKDGANQQTLAGLSAQLRAAAGLAGRLRDPNAAGCGRGGVGAQGAAVSSTGDRANDTAEAGGLFSAGATELFQRLTREADEINNAYASCRRDAINLRGVLK
jgi:hypothetical protein